VDQRCQLLVRQIAPDELPQELIDRRHVAAAERRYLRRRQRQHGRIHLGREAQAWRRRRNVETAWRGKRRDVLQRTRTLQRAGALQWPGTLQRSCALKGASALERATALQRATSLLRSRRASGRRR